VKQFIDQLFGNANDPVKGRQMPVHHSASWLNLVSISSPVGTQIPQAVGAAYAAKVMGKDDVSMVYFGEGTSSPLRPELRRARAIVLLAGRGTEKLRPILDEEGIAYLGPFSELGAAVAAAAARAKRGDAVLLSPGCTSFGMFLHEFDRGRKFKETVRALLEGAGKA